MVEIVCLEQNEQGEVVKTSNARKYLSEHKERVLEKEIRDVLRAYSINDSCYDMTHITCYGWGGYEVLLENEKMNVLFFEVLSVDKYGRLLSYKVKF